MLVTSLLERMQQEQSTRGASDILNVLLLGEGVRIWPVADPIQREPSEESPVELTGCPSRRRTVKQGGVHGVAEIRDDAVEGKLEAHPSFTTRGLQIRTQDHLIVAPPPREQLGKELRRSIADGCRRALQPPSARRGPARTRGLLAHPGALLVEVSRIAIRIRQQNHPTDSGRVHDPANCAGKAAERAAVGIVRPDDEDSLLCAVSAPHELLHDVGPIRMRHVLDAALGTGRQRFRWRPPLAVVNQSLLVEAIEVRRAALRPD